MDITFGGHRHAVVRDYSYSRWAPHFPAISAISSKDFLYNWVLKNPDERFDARSFIQFLDERLLKLLYLNRYMVCFIEGNELVGIKDADFGFELLPESEILISLKGSSLYLQKQILDKFSCRENNTNFQD